MHQQKITKERDFNRAKHFLDQPPQKINQETVAEISR